MKIVNTLVSPLSWGSLQTKEATLGVGLAVILTITAGGVTTALAAQPGDPFLLGKRNALDAATTLEGEQTNGAMLQIGNRSSDFDDPALILRVQAGRPPLQVSAGAGKALNLDADKLDGQDSTAFANGTNGKANDADKLDGKDSTAFANGTNGKANDADKLDGLDSTAFWRGKSYRVTSGPVFGDGGGTLVLAKASCDVGDTLLHVVGGAFGGIEDTLANIGVSPDNRTGTVVSVDNGNDTNDPFFAEVHCADFPPLRP